MMDGALSIHFFLLLFLGFLIILYIIYTKFSKSDRNVRTSDFRIETIEDPIQKSLGMISVTGTTMGGYSKDAVVVSIPLEIFSQNDYSISELFQRITQVSTGSVAASNSGDIQDDNNMTSKKDEMAGIDPAVMIKNISEVEEDVSVLNPEKDLEDLEELAAEEDSDDQGNGEYEFLTDL